MSKLKVGLLFGGKSGEHEISITSACSIARGLQEGDNKEKYEVIPIYVDKEGNWWGKEVAESVLSAGKPKETTGERRKWEFPPDCKQVDVFFPIIHGPNGEDGTIQGLLTLMAIPFVGSGVLGSAVGMDKIAMKNAFACAGLPQVKYIGVSRSEIFSNPCVFPKLCDRLEAQLGYPCFVKPANLGSSVGISKVKNRNELEKALDIAASLDRRVIVEAGVTARELECGILGNDNPIASVVGEISYNAEFYDYQTKYTDGLASLIIPANIPQDVSETIRQMAIKAFQAVDARGLARVDFFYLPESGDILINEINTLPGFTSLSMYPKLWEASGIPFPTLVDKLITLALSDQ